ncbi:MAG: hypothetical protein ACP5UA_07980 [Candidatus Hydrogenedens sp.]
MDDEDYERLKFIFSMLEMLFQIKERLNISEKESNEFDEQELEVIETETGKDVKKNRKKRSKPSEDKKDEIQETKEDMGKENIIEEEEDVIKKEAVT